MNESMIMTEWTIAFTSQVTSISQYRYHRQQHFLHLATNLQVRSDVTAQSGSLGLGHHPQEQHTRLIVVIHLLLEGLLRQLAAYGATTGQWIGRLEGVGVGALQ